MIMIVRGVSFFDIFLHTIFRLKQITKQRQSGTTTKLIKTQSVWFESASNIDKKPLRLVQIDSILFCQAPGRGRSWGLFLVLCYNSCFHDGKKRHKTDQSSAPGQWNGNPGPDAAGLV